MRFIVTGTPRSATKYTAKLLSALDVPCRHESALRPTASVLDVLKWYRAGRYGESSWMAWTVLGMFPEPVRVIHVLRDPWKTLDSLGNHTPILRPGWQGKTERDIQGVIEAYVPEALGELPAVERTAMFILAWSKLIWRATGGKAFNFYADRADALGVEAMLGFLGVQRKHSEIEQALGKVPTNTNGGYHIGSTSAVSDPHVEQFLLEYAKDRNLGRVVAGQLIDEPSRQTPEQLVEQLPPHLVDAMARFCDFHGYPAIVPAAA